MDKPVVKINVNDSTVDIFTVMGEARAAIYAAARRIGYQTTHTRNERANVIARADKTANEMTREVMTARSREDAIARIKKYVTIE